MSSIVVTLLAGGAFGIALAAPPGPMNAIIAEESVLRGFGAGFRAGFGAMVADLLFCVLALVGLVAVVQRAPTLHAVMVGVGGALMLYFAYDAATAIRSSFVGEEQTGPAKGFQKAFVLGITNPYQIVFWLTIGIGLLEPGTLDLLAYLPDAVALAPGASESMFVIETGSMALLAGLFGGLCLWIVAYPAALVALGNRIDAAAPIIAGLSAVVLGGFGVVFLVDAVTRLGLL